MLKVERENVFMMWTLPASTDSNHVDITVNMLEILAGVLGLGVLVLAYMAFGSKTAVAEEKAKARSWEADAAVNRARAAKYKKVLMDWGEDVVELERREEAAHGGSVASAVDRFNARVRKLREDTGGEGGGTDGDGGPVPSVTRPKP